MFFFKQEKNWINFRKRDISYRFETSYTYDSLITNITMKIGANYFFKIKPRKNLIFHAETGQDQRAQIENSQTSPIYANKRKT